MCALSEWAEGLEGLKSEIDEAPGLYPSGNLLIPNLVPSLRLVHRAISDDKQLVMIEITFVLNALFM